MDEQNTQATTSSAQSPIYQESQDKNAKWLWLLIILIIIGALVFAFFRGLGPFAKFRGTGSESASPSPQSISSPISNPSPSPAEEVDKSEPSIRVLNGTGEAGVAASVKDFLENLGWKVTSIGNASQNTEDSTITFKEGFEKFEDSLTGDLSEKYSATAADETLEASDEADIEIVIGAK